MIEGVVLVAPNKIVHIRVGDAGIDALRWAPKSAVWWFWDPLCPPEYGICSPSRSSPQLWRWLCRSPDCWRCLQQAMCSHDTLCLVRARYRLRLPRRTRWSLHRHRCTRQLALLKSLYHTLDIGGCNQHHRCNRHVCRHRRHSRHHSNLL